MNQKISAVIITLNEEKNLLKCLEKLRWVDEIIIIDSGSTDKTKEIAESFKAKFIYNKFEGYGQQKKFAVNQATNDWILSLDADEILTDELINEIRGINFLESNFSGFKIKRKHVFLNRIFNFGYESNRFFLRLFNKNAGTFNDNLVHENVEIKGEINKLNNSFLHYSYDSLDTYIAKLNRYTSLYAISKFEKGKNYNFIEILIKSQFEFFKKYFLELNFLNGKEGFLWAFYSAVYTFTKCAKTNELHKNNFNQ